MVLYRCLSISELVTVGWPVLADSIVDGKMTIKNSS